MGFNKINNYEIRWGYYILYTKFSYNQALTYAMFHSPFEACYGVNPLVAIDFFLLPLSITLTLWCNKAKGIKKLNEKIKTQIDKANASYMTRENKHKKPLVFNPGDLVGLHQRRRDSHQVRQNRIMAC